jgi:hypothetical protein
LALRKVTTPLPSTSIHHTADVEPIGSASVSGADRMNRAELHAHVDLLGARHALGQHEEGSLIFGTRILVDHERRRVPGADR